MNPINLFSIINKVRKIVFSNFSKQDSTNPEIKDIKVDGTEYGIPPKNIDTSTNKKSKKRYSTDIKDVHINAVRQVYDVFLSQTLQSVKKYITSIKKHGIFHYIFSAIYKLLKIGFIFVGGIIKYTLKMAKNFFKPLNNWIEHKISPIINRFLFILLYQICKHLTKTIISTIEPQINKLDNIIDRESDDNSLDKKQENETKEIDDELNKISTKYHFDGSGIIREELLKMNHLKHLSIFNDEDKDMDEYSSFHKEIDESKDELFNDKNNSMPKDDPVVLDKSQKTINKGYDEHETSLINAINSFAGGKIGELKNVLSKDKSNPLNKTKEDEKMMKYLPPADDLQMTPPSEYVTNEIYAGPQFSYRHERGQIETNIVIARHYNALKTILEEYGNKCYDKKGCMTRFETLMAETGNKIYYLFGKFRTHISNPLFLKLFIKSILKIEMDKSEEAAYNLFILPYFNFNNAVDKIEYVHDYSKLPSIINIVDNMNPSKRFFHAAQVQEAYYKEQLTTYLSNNSDK